MFILCHINYRVLNNEWQVWVVGQCAWRSEGNLGYLFQTSTLFEAGSLCPLSLPVLHCLTLQVLGNLMSCGQTLSLWEHCGLSLWTLTVGALWFHMCAPVPAFLWVLSSGPHAWVATLLLTEPHPQPNENTFKKRIYSFFKSWFKCHLLQKAFKSIPSRPGTRPGTFLSHLIEPAKTFCRFYFSLMWGKKP